jgi:hypothetical protein
MKRPDVIAGIYAFLNREVAYRTKCPHCPNLKVCKNRRAPTDCPPEDIGWVQFLVDGKGKVIRSGVIELKTIQRFVRGYPENDPPADVAMPAVQMRMEI